MDQGGRKKRPTNPRKNASLFSIITFFYTFGLIKKSYKQDLEVYDVYEVLPNFASKKLGDELEQKWDEAKKQTNKPSLYKIIWAKFGKTYLMLGTLNCILKLGIILYQPAALGKFIAYFSIDNKTITKADATYYGLLIIGLTILNVFFEYNYQQILKEFAIKVCVSFSSLLYRKSLKLTPAALSDITMGKIVTLMIKDIFTFESAIAFVNDMWNGMVMLAVITYMIYSRIGPAVFVGVAFLLCCIPLQLYLGKKTSEMRIGAAKKTDDRIQVTQEALSAIKIIKMYTWEKFFQKHVTDARKIEIEHLRKIYYIKALSVVIGSLVANISFCLLVVANTWLGNEINAETVFFIITCFGSLRMFISISIPLGISQSAELAASLKRLSTLMNADELQKPKSSNKYEEPRILLDEISLTIKDYSILKNVSLNADSGLTIITGGVGSGKSSLLKIILGEFPETRGAISVHGSISYASQEPWVFPSTVRQNILFGQEYNEVKYGRVLEVCALTFDINNFESGDQTIVGDKGINLSKGQKARISLARACYKESDIYLLDDCLTALDASVNKFVFQKCIKEYLNDKIVVFVSHNPYHLSQADNKLILDDGTSLSLMAQENRLSKRITRYIDDQRYSHYQEPIELDETDLLLEKEPQLKKEIYAEKKVTGKIDYKVYGRYLKYCGGFFTILFVFGLFVLAQVTLNTGEKLVSKWVNLQASMSVIRTKMVAPTQQMNSTIDISTIAPILNLASTVASNISAATVPTNLTEMYIAKRVEYESTFNFYIGLMVATTVLLFIRAYFLFTASSNASRKIHDTMVSSLLNSYMQFFDVHFIGNILNRFSKDLSSIDEYIPFLFYEAFRLICIISGIIFLISSVNPYFLIPSLGFTIAIYFIRTYYIPTGRSLRRLDATTRSPMVGYLNTSLDGLTTIRAYETQNILRDEFDKHQDLFSSTWYMIQCSSRAFSFSIDMICVGFIGIIVFAFLHLVTGMDSGSVGLALTQAFMLTGILSWATKQMVEIESQATSIERALEYTNIKEELKNTGIFYPNWPTYGKIEYKNVNLIYETTHEHILKDVNFVIEPAQKIGIVGRTGAGKSSIISTLFRLYDVKGEILIDGVDIKQMQLLELRSNIAIIPQDPILFSGTIRANIDPINKYSDAEIWEAIKIVKLTEFVPSLDYKITESGTKYSAGQRQLICLARALVTKNKIIVLDEATANMDPETDHLLHHTIKIHFEKSTVITIAHRLHSILQSDKVMVVDGGEIKEFDSPQNLLKKSDGIFAKMAKQAGLANE